MRAPPAPQDVVAGDGTTSVTVICGALLKKCQELLEKGVHPTIISDSFNKAANKACEVRRRRPAAAQPARSPDTRLTGPPARRSSSPSRSRSTWTTGSR
jgi:hypothetical protein